METTMPPSQTAAAASAGEDKTVAIISYLTLIGFIIAIVMHNGKKTQLGAFHLRQALGLIITWFIAGFIMVIPVLGWIAGPILLLGTFVLWILGLVAAAGGHMKPVPILGEQFQKWFGGAFN